MKKLLLFTLILLNIENVFSQSCKFVTKQLDVAYNQSNNIIEADSWIPTHIEGCISNKSFDIEKVAVVSVSCPSSLPVLEKYFINNMEDLKLIIIGACHVRIIQPGAFFNLPNLTNINIRHNAFTKIQAGVFNNLPSLQIFYSYHNLVSEIDDDAFADLPKLELFYMGYNEMAYVRRQWFTNTTRIKEFVMYRNKLRTIPAGMFHGWKELRQLDLSSNLISKIEGKLIEGNAPFMNFVGLHNNRLRSLSPTTFSSFMFIDHLEISANLLNYLSEEFLKNVRVADITIFSNPFTCPCLERINRIFRERNVTVNYPFRYTTWACRNTDVPICGAPSNGTDTCVESVDKKLTRRIINYMKEIRYHTVLDDREQQCAMFDDDDSDGN